MNVLAAQLAKRVASITQPTTSPDGSRLDGPGRKLPTLGQISFADLRDAYRVKSAAARWRRRSADRRDLPGSLQTKAALGAIFSSFAEKRVRVPVIAQVTIEQFGTMLNGTEIAAALTRSRLSRST
jgi:5-methyltetrahydrofolate--homocysteine methyltransferase